MIANIQARFVEKIESMGLPRRKAIEYGAMFVTLCGIYYCYLMRDWNEGVCPPDETISFSQLGVLVLRFLAFTAWPFALVAGFDGTWRSRDAGNVFLASYVAANVLWICKTGCAFCAFGAAFRTIPYVFCAWIAHGIGARLNRLRDRD